MPAGRPSLYSKAYCDEVISCGAEGLSLTAFAGQIGVARSTIGEWINEYPEFSVACKKAQAKRTMFLEKGMLSVGATGPMVTARRFALANAAPDEWREKQAIEHTGANGGAIQIDDVGANEAKRRLAALIAATPVNTMDGEPQPE